MLPKAEEKILTKRICIYVLKDPITNEVRYVGKTKVSLQKRLYQHTTQISQTHKSYWIQSCLQQDLKPHIEEIEKCTDENWQEREMYWIQHYKDLGVRLTNSNDGGLGGHNPSAETRAKLSAANKGKTHSAETRAKMLANFKGNTGKTHSEESRAKMSETHKGKTPSAEARAKMSEAQKRRVQTEETKQKMSSSKKGHPVSNETRAKLSAANKGKTLSDEHRAKMSKSQKERYKRQKLQYLENIINKKTLIQTARS